MTLNKRQPKKFKNVADIALVEGDESASPREAERNEGEEILWNWVNIARWYFADEEVADILEKHAGRLRDA